MFFILSKTISLLLMPVTLVLICLLTGQLSRSKKFRKLFTWSGLLLLLFFSVPALSNQVMIWWEVPPTPFKAIQKPYEAGIVLTGVTNLNKSPHDRTYFNKGADRIMHAVELYKQGKIKNILITGGHNSLSQELPSEAEELARILRQCEIPDSAIILETKARNTYENALFTASILQNRSPEVEYLLITSAFHMRRSKACFDKAGLKTVPFSTDFYTSDHLSEPAHWFPSAHSLMIWRVLMHEWLGLAAYKVKGYI